MRKFFSICIPAYNRAKYLPSLLDSIYAQSFNNFEVVICEDLSKERAEIAKIVAQYADKYPDTLRYFENTENLGYDGNIRRLVEVATGQYCFFMGNDDLMCEGALDVVANAIEKHPNIGFVLKSYAWFDNSPSKISQVIRYFKDEQLLAAGIEAISVCFRRSGVISGFIIHRDAAHNAQTSEYDGTLYYQLHLSGEVLVHMNAIYLPNVLILGRNGEPPEFGHSAHEKNKYTPGHYTSEARINMVAGAIKIARDLDSRHGMNFSSSIIKDYANYFYPYIKDQLTLPISKFIRLYKDFGNMGFYRYPMFHFYCLVCYCLGSKLFDKLTYLIRQIFGFTPQFWKTRS